MSREERSKTRTKTAPAKTGPARKVPVAWEALEDAFENNAPEVHSYLHLDNGEVIRIVDGIADPLMHQRVMRDAAYLRVDPVSSREQYRWMERFIVTVEDEDLNRRLGRAIDGKGAFRRFKDALMGNPIERERWFTFRSERLRACMEAWLATHGIESVEREKWRVPTADDVRPTVEQSAREPRKGKAAQAEAMRKKLYEMVERLSLRELDMLLLFGEFLRERKRLSRARARSEEQAESEDAADPPDPSDEEDLDDLDDLDHDDEDEDEEEVEERASEVDHDE